MDYIDYRSKLGIGFDDSEKHEIFIAKIHNYFMSSTNIDFTEEQERKFCNVIGTRCVINSGKFSMTIANIEFDMEERTGFQRAYYYISSVKDNFNSFLARLVTFANFFNHNKQKQKEIFNTIYTALNESHIPYEVMQDADGYFIFPKGAKELDDALVSQPLEWLKGYPLAHKAFVKALKDYSSATKDNASEVADSLRKALETFFQEFFKGNKSLENYKSEYGDYLKSQGVPAELANDFTKLLGTFTDYNNNYAKHHDKASFNVLEYILYQTGNIIRLLITLNKGEKI